VITLTADDGGLATAAAALRDGLLVAFPTETVYGLGADAFNNAALARVFEAKGRPRFDPLIVHIASLDAVGRVARPEALSPEARARFELVAARLWPGPLTLILPKRAEVPDLATSGLPTVAVRFPAHPVAQRLIALSTGAVAAPSANLFGRLSPTSAAHVRNQLGEKVDFIIDGGPSQVGVESTVLDLCADPVRILRPGGTSREMIEALIALCEPDNRIIVDSKSSAAEMPNSPGMLKSHYAPKTPLLLHDEADMAPYERDAGYLFFSARNRDAWLAAHGPTLAAHGPTLAAPGPTHVALTHAALGPANAAQSLSADEPICHTETFNVRALSTSGSTVEAAANLFAALHQMDALGLARIHAERAPDTGLGPAINDRLERAAV
jgi:L-threonylcarbamoyladenylate synthase